MEKISKIWTTSENKWYEELKVIAPYREYQYDKIIQSHLQTLFPEFHAVPYNRKITQASKPTGSKPDFALIRKDFEEWWIVEVERIEDKLAHVQKQIEDFLNGDYNASSEAKYISNNNSTLSYADIYKATVNIPKVMLIVDDMNSKWQSALASLAPTTCIFKVYRNDKGVDLYSISGDYPYIYEETSHCHFSNAMNNLLELTNPDILNPLIDVPSIQLNKFQKFISNCKNYLSSKREVSSEEVYRIAHNGQISEWKKIEDAGKIYLQPLGPVSTRVNDSYILKRSTQRNFILDRN